MSSALYLEHLSESDLAFLAKVTAERDPGGLRRQPHRLEAALRQPAVFTSLFTPSDRSPLLRVSPFLVFAVLVNRVSQDLGETAFIYEWAGPGDRIPVFDVGPLKDFAGDPLRRLFLAELLASYTRVVSGSFWVQTSRGWRRRRFSDLDPLRLIELLEVAPTRERPGIYRRLGDLMLFLTGVFPDHTAERRLPPVERERLRRFLPRADGGVDDGSNPLWLFEMIGRRSYRVAWKATHTAGVGMARVLGDVAEGFAQARRTLNFLTDRYLFPHREQWFPLNTR